MTVTAHPRKLMAFSVALACVAMLTLGACTKSGNVVEQGSTAVGFQAVGWWAPSQDVSCQDVAHSEGSVAETFTEYCTLKGSPAVKVVTTYPIGGYEAESWAYVPASLSRGQFYHVSGYNKVHSYWNNYSGSWALNGNDMPRWQATN